MVRGRWRDSVANGGTLTVNQGNFDDNQAQGNGGAINSGGELHFSQTIFQDNSAGGDGGAIIQTGGYTMTINITAFLSNTAMSGHGGAIYNSGSNIVSAITAGFFDSNTASKCEQLASRWRRGHLPQQRHSQYLRQRLRRQQCGRQRGPGRAPSTITAPIRPPGHRVFAFRRDTRPSHPPAPPLTILTMNAANTVTGTTSATAGGGAIYNFGPLAVLGTLR